MSLLSKRESANAVCAPARSLQRVGKVVQFSWVKAHSSVAPHPALQSFYDLLAIENSRLPSR